MRRHRLPGFSTCSLSSHPPAALIEFVAVDYRFDVSTRCGEIDLLKKLVFGYLGEAISAAPTLGAAGAGVVLRQSERNWIRLMGPVFHGTMQIPGARLQVCLWFEKLIRIEPGDFVFARPFVGRSFAHLHESALSMTAMLLWIKPAFTPDDGFH